MVPTFAMPFFLLSDVVYSSPEEDPKESRPCALSGLSIINMPFLP